MSLLLLPFPPPHPHLRLCAPPVPLPGISLLPESFAVFCLFGFFSFPIPPSVLVFPQLRLEASRPFRFGRESAQPVPQARSTTYALKRRPPVDGCRWERLLSPSSYTKDATANTTLYRIQHP